MAMSWFKNSVVAVAAVAALALIPSEEANAQIGGYDFGVGFGYGQQSSVRFVSPREDLPYFAKYPPVYYGDMVRRPYGFSPYALPPGIMPAEFSAPVHAPCAQTIINPYVPAPEIVPVPTPPPVPSATDSTPDREI